VSASDQKATDAESGEEEEAQSSGASESAGGLPDADAPELDGILDAYVSVGCCTYK
jgi:hypothetical protein